MDDDDFGELYGDQAVAGLSSAAAGSLHNSYSSYTIFDEEIEEEKASPVVQTIPSPPPHPPGHVTQMKNSPLFVAKLHEPDQLAGRDSDEDDDMLLLGYNSKSGSAGKKVLTDDTLGMGIDDPEEEFTKLTEISKTENVAENGLVLPSAKLNRAAAVCVPGITPTEDGHTVGPDAANHTITIPGLSTIVSAPFFDIGDNGDATQDAWEQQQVEKPHMQPDGGVPMDAADDWDTDSDDGLRIVLNTEYPYYASGEKGGATRYEPGSEDEDDEDLIIFEPPEEGEDQMLQVPDAQAIQGDGLGEKQTGVEDGKGQQDKVLAGVPPAPQAPRGYGYHSYNSHYKYVRAGATTVYNASTGQAPGGRGGPLRVINGRGDWRGPGRGGAFGPHSTTQFSSWSTPSSFEFTLPPSMTVFEIDLDSFDEKPWRQAAVDISDFFNFGFDETTWKDYCKQLAQLRLESTMQSKIRVYESGRAEPDYDPDLPPELAIAAGLQEGGDKIQQRLVETDTIATTTGRRGYMPMPYARPIEVEGGLGDRRPSADSRKQRTRDSDSILLIDAVEVELERSHDENVEPIDGEVDKDGLDEEQQQDEDHEDEEELPLVEEPRATFKMRQDQHPWQKERMPRAPSKPPAEERRDLDHVRSQTAALQDAERKLDRDDTHEKNSRPLEKEDILSCKDAGDEIRDEEHHSGQPADQRINDSRAVTSKERLSREVQADSSGCSSKRQRMVSPEGSHTASWDNGDTQKSARSAAYMKESRDSGESAMDGRDDASRRRKKHRSYSEMSRGRGDQYRDFRHESETYFKKQVPPIRPEIESEVHLHAASLLETRKRPKQGLVERVTLKDLSRHSKDRDEGHTKGREDESDKNKGYLAKEAVHKDKAGSRLESKKRDDEDKETAHLRDKGGSRPEPRRKEEVDRRERHDSRRRDLEDRRDRSEKDSQHRETREIQHRDKELEPSDWHNSDRRKKEDDYRRKGRPEDTGIKKDRERNTIERYDRDSDQHMHRKEEDLSKKEKHDDRHKAKTRDGTLRESEELRQRNVDYQDSHGRSHKEDERAPHSSRSSRRHNDDRAERAWRGRDESRLSDSTRSAEARSHSKDRRKGPDDHGKEKSRLHEGRTRSSTDHEGPRMSDDPRISERGLHSDKHKLDSKRTKEFDREMSDLATQSADVGDGSKRKRSATDKNEQQGNRKKTDSSLFARTRDSQGSKVYTEETKEVNEAKFRKSSAKTQHSDAGDRGSSGEDDAQKGRSKLERWMSHKDLELNMVERLSMQTVAKKDEKLRPGSRDKQHRDSSGVRNDLEQENRHHTGDRKSGKTSSSTEQANGRAPKLKERGDTLALSKEVHSNADKKDLTDLPERLQEDSTLPRTNMAAKLEKRKERFKVPVEDKDNARKLDQEEENQQGEKDDSRQERPPRKRRWASG